MSDSWLDDPSLYVKPKAGATPNFDDPSLYKVAPKAKSAPAPSLIAESVSGADPLFANVEHGAVGDPIGSAGNPIMSASNAPDPYGPIKPGMWFTGPDGVKRRQDTTLLQDFGGGIERAVTGVGDFFKNAPAAIKAQLAADKLKQANRGMYGAGTGNPFPMPDSDRQAMIADAAPALQAASAELATNQIATEQHLKQFPKSVARQDYEKELHDAKGFGKTLRVMASHPGQFAVGAAEGLGPYVPGMILGAVNPALGAAVGGTTMGTQELEAGIPEYFAKNNIDPTTATPEQIAAAATYANNRASIMATLGALPVGNLARIPEAAAARAGLNPLLHEGINYGLGAAATGGTFGTGEAIANLATDGKIDWARVGQQAGMGIGFHLGSGAKHAVDAAGIRASEGFISQAAARKIAQDPKASQESRLAAALYLAQNGERIDAPRQGNVIDPAALAAGNEALRNANQGEPQAPPPAAAPERSAVVPEPEASPAPSELDSLMLRNIIEGNHGDAATAPVPDNIPWEAAAAALGLAPPAPAHADPFLDAARLAAQGLRPDGSPIERARPAEPSNAPEPETAPTPSKASPARVQPSPVENGSNSRILHPGDAEPVDFKVPSQPENIVGGVGHDPVLSALHDMAGGKHPEQALEGADIETVREVAKAMGLKPTAKSRQGAMVERIGEMARADWIKAAKAAVETRGVPKATEPAPVRTRRQAKAEPAVKKPIDLLEAIARNGGLNRDAFRAYRIDPVEFTRRAGFHYVFRKKGGMRPDDLREWMQQEGYLPADHPDRPASVDANDAFDLFDRAFRSGERIYSDDQGDHVARYEEQRRADMAGPDEHDAIDHALAGELGYPDAGAMHDAFANERARQEDRADDIVPEGYNEARSLGELFADPAVRAMSEDEIGRILQLPEADQARALWKAIDERQEATGHFTATDDRGYPRGDERSSAARGGEQAGGIREDVAPFTLKQRGSAGRTPEEVRRATERQGERSGSLFGEPTARDRVDAAQRAKDAERNGQNGEGRTDMAAGDGELFAGDRPEQLRVEQPAWHGSPHTFDRFSLQHIGTGEGAQAYGWGMYFASNKAIAEHYRKGLSNRDLINKARDAYDEFYSPDEAADALRNIDGLSDAQRTLIDALKNDGWLGFDYPHQAISAALRHPDNFDLSPETKAALKKVGSLYRVEIPEDHELLDWDRPLSEQPERVREAIASLGEIKNRSGQDMLAHDPTGQEIYRALGEPQTASKTLNEAGIPGLRYLDGNSRNAGEGSHNYVIWDENAITDHARVKASRNMFASYPKDGETNGRERQDQTGNGRSDLDSGHAGARGDDAGGVGLRADATPSLTKRGKYAVESLVRRFGGSVLADRIARDFRETDTAKLIGRRIDIDPATAADDLALISDVYRNPIFETLRYIFTDKDGFIVGETAVESRMPSSSAAFPTGRDGVEFIMENAPKGATHLWLQHNHPSGNPTPSPADVFLTRRIADRLKSSGAGIEVAGHVVLNHKTYAFIPKDANPATFKRDYSVNPIDRPEMHDPLIADRGLSGQRVGSDADAARIGADYMRQIQKDSFVLVSTDAKGSVSLVTSFPLRALGNPKALGLAAQLAKRSGAYRQFVVLHDANIPTDIRMQVVRALDDGMRTGALTDVVTVDGSQHPVIKHARMSNSGNHVETLLGRNGRDNRAVKVYEDDAGYTNAQTEFMRKAGLQDAPDTRTSMERLQSWARGKIPESWKDHLIQGGFDQYYGLRKASEAAGLSPEESPYYAARLINNASTMEAVLRFGAPKLVDGTLRVDRGVKGLMDALEPVKDSMPQFLGWMVARRAQLLKQQGREHLMTDADIQAGLSLRQGHEQAFDRAALNYLKLKNAVLDLAEKTGVIDPVARAAWDHAEYIPFYREGDAGGAGTRRGLSNQSSGIRTLKGGEAAIRDPLSNIVQNFTRLVDASMKNRAATLAVDKLAGDLFEKVPMAVDQAMIPLNQVKKHLLSTGVDQATIDGMPASALKGMAKMLSIKPPEGEDVIRIMRGGKAEYYRVKDPFLLTALTAMHETPTPMFVKMLAYPKHLLTAGATATPDFMIANMLRDTGEAAVTSKDRFIPVWDTLRGAVDAFRHDELAQDLMMAGASFHGGYFRTGDAEATSSAIRKALSRGGHDRSFIDKYVKTLASPARLKDLYFDLLGATEQGSRLSTAKRRLDAGGSFADAAFEAKDLLDFQLRGAASSVRVFTQILPFLNARMQGAYRLGRIGTSKGRRNAVAARLAAMALTSAALYAINSELFGQGYDDLEDWDKDTNWHIAPGTKYHTRIPKPFELGLIGGTLPERMYGAIRYQLGKEDNADRPGQSVDSMVRAITGVLELNPLPQAAKPIVEDWANRDMYFNRAIESQGDKFRSPKDRYGNNTSDTMRAASSAMQSVVGSDYALSPKRMEHLWRGYTAGMGMYALHAADWLTRKAEGSPERPDMLLRDFPVVGRFARGSVNPATRFQGDFYDLKDQADAKSAEIKVLVEHGDDERAAELEQKWGWLLGERTTERVSKNTKGGYMYTGVREANKVEKQLADLRKSDAAIYADPDMSGAEKRQKLNENAAERNAITREAVKEMRRRQRAASSQ